MMPTKNRFLGYLTIIIVALMIVEAISCSGRSDGSGNAVAPSAASGDDEQFRLISLSSPSNYDRFVYGDMIDIAVNIERAGQMPDSVVVSLDGKRVGALFSEPWNVSISSSEITTLGRKTLKVTAFRGGRSRTNVSRILYVYSDIKPEYSGYEVVNVYPHDREAFTQGLFFDGGKLYEGTGQEGYSSLREIDLASGRVDRQLNLEPNLFGEGITMFGNLIYQVTWTSKVGFVYQKEDFKLVRKIYYQSEGWGLTTVEGKIVMSDGTSTLWLYDPDMFTIVSRIEVCDDDGPVEQLNELEYINGEIWANIWMTDRIVRIDPASGKVHGYVDLSGLLDDPGINTDKNVLNGIAYDEDNDRIFVTGKNWPKLFEIRLKPR